MINNDQSTSIEAPEVYKSIPTHFPSKNQRQNVPGKNVDFDTTFDGHVMVNYIEPNLQEIIFRPIRVGLITQKQFWDHLKNCHSWAGPPKYLSAKKHKSTTADGHTILASFSDIKKYYDAIKWGALRAEQQLPFSFYQQMDVFIKSYQIEHKQAQKEGRTDKRSNHKYLIPTNLYVGSRGYEYLCVGVLSLYVAFDGTLDFGRLAFLSQYQAWHL
jgi:hypothetical protein